MNNEQISIAFGKYVSGYRPGDEGWSELDQEAYDEVMETKVVNEGWCEGCSPENCSGCGPYRPTKKENTNITYLPLKVPSDLIYWINSKEIAEEWCKGYAREMIEAERKRLVNAFEKRYEKACKDKITDYDGFCSGVACGYAIAIQIVEGEIEE